MKADPISVGKVLSENHRFVVPIYQRTYGWTEKSQLEPLFAQIEAKAQERLQKGSVDFPHYMGALLVIPEGEAAFGRIQVRSRKQRETRNGLSKLILCGHKPGQTSSSGACPQLQRPGGRNEPITRKYSL
ncbi:MAG: DUF262 domain-containing protein [Acidobacteriaceae bacterium]